MTDREDEDGRRVDGGKEVERTRANNEPTGGGGGGRTRREITSGMGGGFNSIS